MVRRDKQKPERRRASSGTGADCFKIEEHQERIICEVCGHESRDPHDIETGYCPRCREFHQDRALMSRLQEGHEKKLDYEDQLGPEFDEKRPFRRAA